MLENKERQIVPRDEAVFDTGVEAVKDERSSFTRAILPVIACGAGLFSDGYLNNVSTRYLLHHLLTDDLADRSLGPF